MTHNYLQSMNAFEIFSTLFFGVGIYLALKIAFVKFFLTAQTRANLYFTLVSLVGANIISWHCALTGSL